MVIDCHLGIVLLQRVLCVEVSFQIKHHLSLYLSYLHVKDILSSFSNGKSQPLSFIVCNSSPFQ